MSRGKYFTIGAVLTALASSLCCLPALLFLVFGVSSGFLAFFTKFEFARWILVGAAFVFLLFGYIANRQTSCDRTKKESRGKRLAFYIGLFVVIVALSFYPEIVPLFMEE